MNPRRAVLPGMALLGVLGLLAAVGVAVARSGAPAGSSTTTTTAAAPPACAPPSAGNHSLVVDQGRAPVLLHVPRRGSATRRPLILVLPGAGMTGRDMANYTGYDRLADRKGFLVAYPTAAGRRPFWNVSGQVPGKPDDVAYLRAVIRSLTGPAGCADAARVGITGVSNGGGMSALMACRAADLLAAAAPVAGGYSTLPDCRPQRALPLLEIHGMRDTVVPYQGKQPHGAGNVGDYLSDWLERDRCDRRARRSTPVRRVVELRWRCRDGRIVAHYRVLDAEHGWPGERSLRPFSATVRTWRFLSAFRNG